MLKIHVQTSDEQGPRFVLAGRLAGPWVEELRRAWRPTVDAHRRAASVDLRETTYIDAAGRALLEEMCREGVELQASGCLMNTIVEEVRACAHRRTADEPVLGRSSPATDDHRV